MKLRKPWMIKAAAFLAAWLLRVWIGTLRFRYIALGPDWCPTSKMARRGRYIYAFWHEGLLLPGYHYGRKRVRVLIGQHADGQLIAEIMRHLGFGLVRGSTTRGGVEAVRQMLKISKKDHLAITPDGPRGPRRQVQMGLIYLASKTGLPIYPGGLGYDRPWRMQSWDRFALPRPGSRAACICGEPIYIPTDASRADMENYRRHVEDELNRLTAMAEELAETGRCPQLRNELRQRVAA
jgi:lysophospholipid acyltransferase (LPLAT)-like uncharacterized protein